MTSAAHSLCIITRKNWFCSNCIQFLPLLSNLFGRVRCIFQRWQQLMSSDSSISRCKVGKDRYQNASDNSDPNWRMNKRQKPFSKRSFITIQLEKQNICSYKRYFTKYNGFFSFVFVTVRIRIISSVRILLLPRIHLVLNVYQRNAAHPRKPDTDITVCMPPLDFRSFFFFGP